MTYITRRDANQLADTLELLYDIIRYFAQPDRPPPPSLTTPGSHRSIGDFHDNYGRFLGLLRYPKKGT